MPVSSLASSTSLLSKMSYLTLIPLLAWKSLMVLGAMYSDQLKMFTVRSAAAMALEEQVRARPRARLVNAVCSDFMRQLHVFKKAKPSGRHFSPEVSHRECWQRSIGDI
ncbi:hypothetical protein P308_13785 [Pseudomonas piscis]|nr:hypothetical protein P308_13785 [Pseudomonas piscis]